MRGDNYFSRVSSFFGGTGTGALKVDGKLVSNQKLGRTKRSKRPARRRHDKIFQLWQFRYGLHTPHVTYCLKSFGHSRNRFARERIFFRQQWSLLSQMPRRGSQWDETN